ncbi:MAG: molybdate ABC transporter substrate-binding protein [Steroidobacteraceae bacterium]
MKMIAGSCLLLLALISLCAPAAAQRAITVFAAASLTDVMQDLGDSYTRFSSVPVHIYFAASCTLAHQIENGSRADVFVSTDRESMDYLQMRNLIQPLTRHDVAQNRLVLIAPTDSRIELKIAPHFALAAALGKGRLAAEGPDSLPAGRDAQQALMTLGVWDEVSDRIARADGVRAALALVDRGEAPLGIVYQTDALIDKNVRVVDVFPIDSYKPMIYPAALTNAANADAAKFLGYVLGPAGKKAFTRYGFTPLP